ncbi:MAG TPA: BON domain-containing protein [Steroidobacteraceae bacterium]|nr:BON domain-containing protein [Steroidobacteraceae bacterium]
MLKSIQIQSINRLPSDDKMGRPYQFPAWALALVLVADLSGCATYGAYRKCGFGGCPGDATITTEVQALFDQHPVLQPPNLVYVRTLDHVVYLNGLVDTDSQRQLAQSIALEATGVARVVNSIGISNNR